MGLLRRRREPRSLFSAFATYGARPGGVAKRCGKTAKNRYARALAAVTDWCRTNRHRPIKDQHAHLSAMMRGHYAYYGVSGNYRRLSWYADEVASIWKKWLSRRDRRKRFLWSRFSDLLKRYPLPAARIVHRYTTLSEARP